MKDVLKNLLLICVTFLLNVSCKKLQDDPAVITITSPLSGSVFMAGDTILVEASMTDDNDLGTLTVKLLNSSYTPVAHQEQFALNYLNEYQFTLPYVIDNLYLETGNY